MSLLKHRALSVFFCYMLCGSALFLSAQAKTDAGTLANTSRKDPAANSGSVIIGANIWNEGFLSPAEQDAELKQMVEGGVKVIRTSLMPNTTDFITLAFKHNIGSVLIVYPFLGSKAKPRGGWARYRLSELTAQEFTEGFKPLLDKLEAAGVRLAAFELGNEINSAGYNGDLDDPGSGRELMLANLKDDHDSEGRTVAQGYRAYIGILAALKDLRDHSKLNRQTPIITGGLGGRGVNLLDTLRFFIENGANKYADGYGVHVYPSADLNRPVATRVASLEEGIFSACTQDKPCWITEWGFGAEEKCPPVETTRVKLIQAMRSAFGHFASQKRLGGLIWYDWADKPGQPDSWAIFRCGATTEAGKLALSPM